MEVKCFQKKYNVPYGHDPEKISISKDARSTNGRVNNDTHNVLSIAAFDTINWGTPLSSSNESRVIRKNNGVSPIKGLQRNLCPFKKKRAPCWSLPLPYFLLFISLAFASPSSGRSLQVVVIEITPLTRQTSRYISDYESRRLYRVSPGTIFAPFNFDYESPRVTWVSVRGGGLRAAAIVVGNLQHSPPVSSQCAHVQRLKTHEGILSLVYSLYQYTRIHSHAFLKDVYVCII